MLKVLIPIILVTVVIFAIGWLTWFTYEYLRKPKKNQNNSKID